MIKRDFPPFREQLKEAFGYLSFQCSLINLDVVGIEIAKRNATISLLYLGDKKVGYFSHSNLSEEQCLSIFKFVPLSRNDLENWANENSSNVTLYHPPKRNFVFIADDVVTSQSVLNQIKKELKE